jgi:hypothetical protein
VEWVAAHDRLAREWSERLGRGIGLVAYEGGPHLDGRGAAYQAAFHAATNDPRMGDIYRDYLRAVDAAGLDLYVDFQFTGADGAAPWGDFAKLHRMDQPLAEAHRYRAVVAAADGSLWDSPPPPVTPPPVTPPPVTPPPPLGPPQFSISGGSLVEGHAGRRWLTFTITLSHASTRPTSVGWATGNGSAVAGRDYVKAAGRIAFAVGQTVRTIRVAVIGDRLREADERFHVGLGAAVNARLATTARLAWATILDDDRPAAAAGSLFAALVAAASETTTTPASR